MKRLALAIIAVALAGSAAAQDLSRPARELFAAAGIPSPLAPAAVGSYAGGCLAGAVALPVDGPNWQAMRLERNRNWGHPAMISYLERLAADAARLDGWNGILVGDISQPRGGPSPTGHVSHQTGLDADLWYIEMPASRLTEAQRSGLGAQSLIAPGTMAIDPSRWDPAVGQLIRRAASYPEVARIFVHPGIKAELCRTAGADRDWLNVVRPWYGHDDHFHVRLHCPAGEAGCVAQAPPPAGDGCGEELDYWLGPEPYRPADPPAPPTPPLTLATLPAACTGVLLAGVTPPPIPPLPYPRPR